MIKELQSPDFRFSWSMLELYKQCPFKFHQKYILKKKEPSNIFGLYGCALHELIARLYTEEKFYSGYAYAIWVDVLQKEYKLDKKKEQYKNIIQKEVSQIKYLGFKHIKAFFEVASLEGLLKPAVLIEKTYKGNYKNHKLKIRLDLLINTKHGLTLIDWKSGKPTPQVFHQLVLYASLAQKKFGRIIDAVAPVFLKTKKMYPEKITLELRKKTGVYIGDTYKAMLSDKKFKPKKNEYCKYCFLQKEKCLNVT